MKPVLQLRGVQDTVEVYEDHVNITPKGFLGFLNKGMKGTKEIPFHSIVAVQLRKASTFVNGYLQFTIAGGNESRGGVFSATKDENTFFFNKKANTEALAMKTFIDEKIAAFHTPNSGDRQGLKRSIAEEIAELAALKSQGALTDEEFTAAKKRLLS